MGGGGGLALHFVRVPGLLPTLAVPFGFSWPVRKVPGPGNSVVLLDHLLDRLDRAVLYLMFPSASHGLFLTSCVVCAVLGYWCTVRCSRIGWVNEVFDTLSPLVWKYKYATFCW